MAAFFRRVRTMNASDAPTAAEWIIRSRPVPEPLARLLPDLLQKLILEETLSGVVAEYIRDADSPPEFAAFGISGFVSEECAKDYLAAPVPHFGIALLDRAGRGYGEGLFLRYEEIAEANAGEGVSLFPLFWLQRSYDVTDPEARILLGLGQQAFLSGHRGYRLARILKEAPAHLASSFLGGGFREHCRLPAGTPFSFHPEAGLEEEFAVFDITRAELEGKWPSTAVGHLFAHQQPRCGFTRFEQQVLIRAVDGLTDTKIARDLGITADAVAMRWRSIYTRVLDNAPSVLRSEECFNGARGQEKRRLVIAFVSEHPEELRPYARPARRNGKASV